MHFFPIPLPTSCIFKAKTHPVWLAPKRQNTKNVFLSSKLIMYRQTDRHGVFKSCRIDHIYELNAHERHHKGTVLLTACASVNCLLALKLYCQVLLKTRSDELALNRRGHSYFCAWPYWICICRSFPFRCKSYGRRVFKWITQCVLITFALVKLLAFAPLFNASKFCAWNGCNYCC